ncbi:MAG: MotA/TolQ/ExbB proton channel family protein [Candidatus Scalinduaceae bacterium]
MSVITYLQAILYTISSALIYPVIILLICLLMMLIITMGRFLGEYISRRRHLVKHNAKELIGNINNSELHDIIKRVEEFSPRLPHNTRNYFMDIVQELKKSGNDTDMRVEYLLQSREQQMTKKLDGLRLLIRVGPSLGLMGTIIPMGSALAALSQGDIEKMSGSMIIAFSTTVIGLLIGIGAYFTSMLQNRWLNEDIKNIEYLTEGVMRKYEISKEKT